MRSAGPRAVSGLVAALVLATTVVALPASAQDRPPVTTHIVGGSQAGPDQFPFAAALVARGASRYGGFTCTASVLSRSWALTASHCVEDQDERYPDSSYGPYVAPSAFDVVTGTSSLTGSDGQRLQVVAIHVHPSHVAGGFEDDVALLRLGRPTSAPAVTIVGASEGSLDDPGRTTTVMGWGVTFAGSGSPSPDLRYVDVPIQSSSTCTDAYPPGPADPSGYADYHDSNMFCAGPIGGGKDSCQGDSGGPAVVKAGDGSWRQIGTVSFGTGCALPGYPGVYSRLTATSSWIGSTRRFGPFDPDGNGYVARQYVDFVGHLPTVDQRAAWVRQLKSSPPADIITSLQASPAWDGNAGMNARLYRAAFLRNPDTGGFDYWVRKRWSGAGPVSIANHFTASSEFRGKYGSLSTNDFVTRIYQNVFDRDPDPGGRAYWVKKLDGGAGRGQMLYELSNSSELRRDTATLVRIITTRFGLLRAVPTAAEITSSQALSQRALIDTLRTSFRYASRFDA
jgi:secreted trypsin-like serine protease